MTRRAKPPRVDPPPIAARTVIALVVTGILLACVTAGWIPPALGAWYALASLLSFGAYWRDKRAAQQSRQRTPERTLQLLALAGGWPGALFAQSLLHHKNRKVSFQQVFWVCVVANVAVISLLLRDVL